MQVFLVENSPPIRARLKATVEELGGRVVGEAATEHEAIVGLALKQPQIAIVDLALAEGNGLTVLRQVKRRQPTIVVVMLTDHDTRQYQQVCMLSGADFFMEKAADYSVLVDLLRTLEGVIAKTSEGLKREA